MPLLKFYPWRFGLFNISWVLLSSWFWILFQCCSTFTTLATLWKQVTQKGINSPKSECGCCHTTSTTGSDQLEDAWLYILNVFLHAYVSVFVDTWFAACEYLHVYTGGSRASRNLIQHPSQEENPSHTPDNNPSKSWVLDIWLKPHTLCIPSHCKSTRVSKGFHHPQSTLQIRFYRTGVPKGDLSSI